MCTSGSSAARTRKAATSPCAASPPCNAGGRRSEKQNGTSRAGPKRGPAPQQGRRARAKRQSKNSCNPPLKPSSPGGRPQLRRPLARLAGHGRPRGAPSAPGPRTGRAEPGRVGRGLRGTQRDWSHASPRGARHAHWHSFQLVGLPRGSPRSRLCGPTSLGGWTTSTGGPTSGVRLGGWTVRWVHGLLRQPGRTRRRPSPAGRGGARHADARTSPRRRLRLRRQMSPGVRDVGPRAAAVADACATTNAGLQLRPTPARQRRSEAAGRSTKKLKQHPEDTDNTAFNAPVNQRKTVSTLK